MCKYSENTSLIYIYKLTKLYFTKLSQGGTDTSFAPTLQFVQVIYEQQARGDYAARG